VAPHHLRLYQEDDEDEQDERLSIPNLEYHRVLGQGFFGQVWLVSSRRDNDNSKCHYYALKKLSKYHLLCEDQVENTIREKQLLEQFHHPGIVPIIASHQDDHFLYLLLPFLQGGELFSLLHNHSHNDNSIPESHAQFYTASIADALWYLHVTCRTVYRDLKPENVCLDATGYPVLVDFGYARQLLSEHEKAWTLCGSPKYLAPECIQGNKGHSFACDYWSLGVLVYELLTSGREHPFQFWEGMSDYQLYEAVTDAEYLPLPTDDVSAPAADFVDQLLRKDPAQRLGADESVDGNAILAHPWLVTSKWQIPLLRRKLVPAPWVPAVDGARDARYFDSVEEENDDDHDLLTASAHLTAREQERFADF